MLAANFLTAKKLGLSELERTALIGILGMLERGELPFLSVKQPLNPAIPSGRWFNMSIELIASERSCGSIGCIGGWCDALYGTSFMMKTLRSTAIDRLFFPPMNATKWERLTADDGARAIRSYLTTGEPEWTAL